MQRFTVDQKRVLLSRIKDLDPNSVLVGIATDSSGLAERFTYSASSGLKTHEAISKPTDEEYVRAYLVVHLCSELGYRPEAIELEKTYTIGRPSPTKAQIDVLIRDIRDPKHASTFAIIEAKRPDEFFKFVDLIEDQLFSVGNQEHASGLRYAIWYTVEFKGDRLLDHCIVIDFRQYPDYHAWLDAGEPGHNLELPIEYGSLRKSTYRRGDKTHDLRTDLTRQDFTALQKDFHNLLWGGAKMGDSEVFNNLMKVFLAKIYDEQTTQDGAAYQLQVQLVNDHPETSDAVLIKTNRLYRQALAHYFKYPDDVIRRSEINREKFRPEKVTYVVEALAGLSLTENRFSDDVLGAFFESIVRTGFKQERGQFFTHANIAKFMVYGLSLDTWAIERLNSASPRLPYIIDPACGSGTFLIEAMKVITNSVLRSRAGELKPTRLLRDYVQEWFQPDALNKNLQNRWAREFVYGIEDNEDLAAATKVNMILHGDGNTNIEKTDGLTRFPDFTSPRLRVTSTKPEYCYDVNEKFDCIITNPPFSLKEDPRTIASYRGRFAYSGKRNSENLFIERWYQLLAPEGRLAAVLPESVFDTTENLYIRCFLFRFFHIKAIVSLPQVAFQPYTPTKTSLLFASKKAAHAVAAWDSAWRLASKAYNKLRRSAVAVCLLKNSAVLSRLVDVSSKLGADLSLGGRLISPTTFDSAQRDIISASMAGASPALARRAATALKDVDEFIATGGVSLSKISNGAEVLARLLHRENAAAFRDNGLGAVEAQYEELVQALQLDYSDSSDSAPYCNARWCLAELAATREEFDTEILFLEATEIGYKRTTRHPEGLPRPNDLYSRDENGVIELENSPPRTLLEAMRVPPLF